MIGFLKNGFALVLAALAAGCSTVEMLPEPKTIPMTVDSYGIRGLSERIGDVPTALEISECVDSAVITSRGFSGVASIVACFPVRKLVEREFGKVVAVNFRPPLPDEEPRLQIRVRTRRIGVERVHSKVACDMNFDIELTDLRGERKQIFRKSYRMSASGVQRNKEVIPDAVYACVQNLARDVLEDVSKSELVISRIMGLLDD